MQYRRDIDGLRALAVVPVVLFHAGVPGISGGFVGVDVFFVISGYLITSLITEEMREGRFSILTFYERRVRRIFPALIVMLVVSSIFAALLLIPSQFYNFAKSLFATALFASNVFFWRQDGYFAVTAIEQPLLHTWSLAVEEQFYLVYPLALLVIWRWLNRRWIAWLAAIAVISFAANAWGAYHKVAFTFYLAPTRAWELLLGALIALGAFPLFRNRWAREISGLGGVCLIAWAVFAFNPATVFPGANALFPAGGAALVLWSGRDRDTAVAGLLGMRPLVFIGLISYSLYLWHWPLLVFAQAWNIEELSGGATAAVIGLSFLCAVLSWRFVELPFRRLSGQGLAARGPLFQGAAVAMAGAAAFGLFGYFSHGWPSRLSLRVQEVAAYSDSYDPRQQNCLANRGQPIPVNDACIYGARRPPAYAVWGDSHAGALMPMIGDLAKKHGTAAVFFGFSSCPPVEGIKRIGSDDCERHNADVMTRVLSDGTIPVVILIARWSAYLTGPTSDFGPAERGLVDPGITDDNNFAHGSEGIDSLFARQVKETTDRLLAAGKVVVLVYPIPETGYDIPATLAAMIALGRDPAGFTRPEDYYFQRQAFLFSVFDKLRPSDRIIRIYPNRRLCDGVQCIVYSDGKPLYRDDDHLSLVGADFLAPLFEPIFDRLNGAKGQRIAAP